MALSETYQTIQSWITRQLEYEATHGSPAPLTDTQRKLLEKLQIALPPAIPPQPEPDLGDANWIGLLLEYRAARQRVSTKAPGGDFSEIPGPVVYGVQKWHYQVRIDEHSEPFPGPDGGLFPDGTMPSFARKKDAKKYAAKCAVEWLGVNRYMSRLNVNGVKSPPVQEQPATPQPSPARKKQKVMPSSPENPEASTSSPQPNEDSESFLPKGIASTFNGDEVSAVFEAERLCTGLGYPSFPQFKVTESKMAGFYNGLPELGALALKLPPGIGHVKDIYGKKAVREKIAEELLEPLRKLAAQSGKTGSLPVREAEPQVPA
ncbi:putative rrna-processing protein [Daldinia childiae]|uniref:putative rrna-processing protein n=1 Tax=Daldinia childiae TaxID=326645 RepID=UPI001446D2DD|nr:putative rrna-processing protein [Daldinia childiae]KAF3065342.1 putative rrna-processing protein [Daldinia childiae]